MSRQDDAFVAQALARSKANDDDLSKVLEGVYAEHDAAVRDALELTKARDAYVAKVIDEVAEQNRTMILAALADDD